jgi:adenylate kinase
MLRAAAASGTPAGLRAKEIMDAGKLVPDDVMIRIVREVLASPRASGGFILDGFPRTLAQAMALSHIFEELEVRDFKVIEFVADDEEIVRRLANRLVCPADGQVFNVETDGLKKGDPCPQCGTPLIQRDDDREETVRERLKVYHMSTAPVIHYYQASGVVLSVDGTGSIDVVNREIKLMIQDAEAS